MAATVTTAYFLRSTFFLRRLQKSRSEREDFEGELKDLQNSLLSMKKQMPDDNRSLAEVIHVHVSHKAEILLSVWVTCRGLIIFLLQYV